MSLKLSKSEAARLLAGKPLKGRAHGKSTKTANKAESAYGDELFCLKAVGVVLEYQFKPEPLPLGPNRRRWEPDYLVTFNTGQKVYVDVKGDKGRSYRIEEDAREKLRHVAFRYPQYVIRIVWKAKSGEWKHEDVRSV